MSCTYILFPTYSRFLEAYMKLGNMFSLLHLFMPILLERSVEKIPPNDLEAISEDLEESLREKLL